MHRYSSGYHKKGGHGGRGGGKQLCPHLTQTLVGENLNAKGSKGQESSNSASDDDDNLDDLGSKNGDRCD